MHWLNLSSFSNNSFCLGELARPPNPVRFLHLLAAAWNCGDIGSIPLPGATVNWPPGAGSGNSVIPSARMHCAKARASALVSAATFGPLAPHAASANVTASIAKIIAALSIALSFITRTLENVLALRG
jgi:hypothetical protein